jgi:hypothetical protein
MRPELDIYGVYIPSLAVLAIVSFALCTAFERLLARLGFYRFVWHRSLFNAALYIITLWLAFYISKDFPL